MNLKQEQKCVSDGNAMSVSTLIHKPILTKACTHEEWVNDSGKLKKKKAKIEKQTDKCVKRRIGNNFTRQESVLLCNLPV
jgi:hypothetical protein